MKKDGSQLAPKANKTLLVINSLLLVAGIVCGVISLNYKEYVPAVAMLLVTASAIFNIYGALKRLKKIE